MVGCESNKNQSIALKLIYGKFFGHKSIQPSVRPLGISKTGPVKLMMMSEFLETVATFSITRLFIDRFLSNKICSVAHKLL